jgi:3-methyladenine DNA glycosylase AlkD
MNIIDRIRSELKSNADMQTKASFQRFFKEEAKFYGVKSSIVGKIAARYWNVIKDSDKAKILSLCEQLYRSDYSEEAFIANNWAERFTFMQAVDIAIYERWIDKYINNWAKCDGLCNHAVGDLISKYPEKANVLFKWAKSDNRWMRRAAAVSLIVPAKKGKFLNDAFRISDMLLMDKDDMVQKGYGWLLKEESRTRQREVFNFVMERKDRMPRTALRYAIELMPQTLRKRAMA